MEKQPKPTDLLGIAPYGEAIKIATEKSFEVAEKFLEAICLPAASEFGLLLRDRVRVFRAKNLANIANKAQKFVSIGKDGIELKAPPRLVAEVIESGSWCEDEHLQNMWAGLLAVSCTGDGGSETNLLFTDILKRMTSAEAKLVNAVCRNAQKYVTPRGELRFIPFEGVFPELFALMGLSNIEELEFHLQHIYTQGLLKCTGYITFHDKSEGVGLVPETLGLYFYIRCSGSRKTPTEFFNLTKDS